MIDLSVAFHRSITYFSNFRILLFAVLFSQTISFDRIKLLFKLVLIFSFSSSSSMFWIRPCPSLSWSRRGSRSSFLAKHSPYFVYCWNRVHCQTLNYTLEMKLYVGNLGEGGTITSDDLRPLFETYGTVTECECIKNYA